jgi:hypothetical protein
MGFPDQGAAIDQGAVKVEDNELHSMPRRKAARPPLRALSAR